MTAFRSFADTDTGMRRQHNEDCYVNRPDLGLWAVADGAGGHQAGDVAAVDKVIGDIQPGDCFLLCSDGLSKTLTDDEIATYLSHPEDISPSKRLMAAALLKGASDNVTAVVVEAIAEDA